MLLLIFLYEVLISGLYAFSLQVLLFYQMLLRGYQKRKNQNEGKENAVEVMVQEELIILGHMETRDR